MRMLSLLLLLLPSLLGAQVLTVDHVLVRSVDPLTQPALEADPVELALVRGTWLPPTTGDVWHRADADSAGWIRDGALRGGYAFATVTVDRDTTLILEGMGYRGVYVNGEPRVGNVYGYTDTWQSWQPRFDFSLLPVRLRAGENALLFSGSRYGVLRARLRPASGPRMLNARDVTLPDLIVGEAADTRGAIVVMNATGATVTDAWLMVQLDGGPRLAVELPALPPYGVRKVGFPIQGPATAATGTRVLHVALGREAETDAADLELAVKRPGENRRVTFTSGIDGSVQYYGWLPARGEPGPKALLLSLHGASVEAINQSGSYPPLAWAHVIAPTNRRPFGFDWEDWGRLDALEVLDLVQERLDVAPDRIYLTGHSMGGHGAWHVASLYPDRFAAVGPSAGWISFSSYVPDRVGSDASRLSEMIARAALPGRTLEAAPNLTQLGVYILHGTEDESVPVDEARAMRSRLEELGADLAWHEEPGAGHWWDVSDAPGADCVAWAPMLDFLARHRRPAPDEVREVHFLTPSPGVSAWNHWACVAGQQRPFVMSAVDLRLDPLAGRVTGTTGNVSVLGLDLAQVDLDSVRVELDGEPLEIAVPLDRRVWLVRDQGWQQIVGPAAWHRTPQRYGAFREAFVHRPQLVYGTRGTAAENAWALAKARYDAEHLWYQGNASLDVLPDTLYDPTAEPDRNVILYGNADTHEDWAALWPDTAVTVVTGRLSVGDHDLAGAGLGLLAVRPRPGSDMASVGVVAGTGLAGMRLTERRPYLAPGTAYPDLTVLEDRGDGTVVRAAGFFGNDWSLARGELVWADE